MGSEELVFAWTNVKKTTYYLHRRVDSRGNDRFVFAREVGEGALAEVPDGYVVRETLNGTVSLARVQPRVIREDEEQVVVAALRCVHRHAAEIKKNTILVLEGAPAVEMFGQVYTPRGQFSPVLQFTLVDPEERTFQVCRMTYRGHGGWSHPLGRGRLRDLVRQTVPHLGKQSFYELY